MLWIFLRDFGLIVVGPFPLQSGESPGQHINLESITRIARGIDLHTQPTQVGYVLFRHLDLCQTQLKSSGASADEAHSSPYHRNGTERRISQSAGRDTGKCASLRAGSSSGSPKIKGILERRTENFQAHVRYGPFEDKMAVPIFVNNSFKVFLFLLNS